ncbi:MAG: hypothetical protein IID44_27555 [Planctomycetes bacterium]|nr:hypothetical protein [Planctomycetota bacterium]
MKEYNKDDMVDKDASKPPKKRLELHFGMNGITFAVNDYEITIRLIVLVAVVFAGIALIGYFIS